MNEKQQIFFIFVDKANLADSKFTCQRDLREARSKRSKGSTAPLRSSRLTTLHNHFAVR
jgi:hypothetical protein